MAPQLAPIFFETIYKDKLWGGQKIRSFLGKDFGDLPNCGETWEISGVPGNVSIVADGPFQGKSLMDLMQALGADLLGQQVHTRFPEEFPLLIKFIDANDDLSIQVHPDDELARQRHNSFGKTEMWYIMQADPGASLITGFTETLDRERYQAAFQAGQLTSILNREVAQAGDVFFLPAGRVHTIGKGLLLAEIQQTSDVTYRIYDFDRTDDQGNNRELHVEQALDAIDYRWYPDYKTHYTDKANAPVTLVDCPYFHTNKLHFDQPLVRDYRWQDSFKVLICVDGTCYWDSAQGRQTLRQGQACLVPASVPGLTLLPDGQATLLEVYVPAP